MNAVPEPRDRSQTTPAADSAETEWHVGSERRESDAPGLPSLPGYEIERLLGRGGMGVVYRARETALHRAVALKMIAAGSLASDELQERFRSEAHAAARVQHPGVVQIFGFGEDSGRLYLALELLEGGTLAERLTGVPWVPRRAAETVLALAEAMAAAHAQGVVHRDLKPANILFDAQGNPKIGDFGLAKILNVDSSCTQTGQLLGTPCYMAPEQALGDSVRVGPPTDVYALGAILYELASGRPPFQGASVLETLEQVRSREPIPLRELQPRLPRDLETIAHACLEKDPRRRYASAADLADDLRRFLTDQPLRVRPPGPWQRSLKFARRHRLLVASVSAVIAALGLGAVLAATGFYQAAAERDRARDAERETRRLLAASYADAAQWAVGRGQWREAVVQFERAIDAGHEDDPGLRIGRARALLAVGDPRVYDDVERLAAEPLPQNHRGTLRFLQGDLALGRDNAHAEALLREALEAGVSPADAAYARGLLATTSTAAAEEFATALRHDPFHHRAGHALTLTLLLLGRLDEARERIAVSERIAPDDPNPQLFRAMLAALAGDLPAAERTLEAAAEQLGADERADCHRVLRLLNLVHSAGEITAQDFSPLERRAAEAQRLVLEFALPQATSRRSASAFAMPPAVARSLGQLPAAFALSTLTGRLEPGIEALDRAARLHPEGTLFYLHGLWLFAEQRMPESHAAFERALAAPALTPIRRAALYHAVVVAAYLGRPNQEAPDLAMRQNSILRLRELVRLGPARPQEELILIKAARAGEAWELALGLLADAERRGPLDAGLLRQRAQVQLALKADAAARDTARQALANDATDAEMQRIVAEAERRLRASATAP